MKEFLEGLYKGFLDGCDMFVFSSLSEFGEIAGRVGFSLLIVGVVLLILISVGFKPKRRR